MRTKGIKVLDRALETCQVYWLVVRIKECPDEATERRLIETYFLVPHTVWSTPPAFVEPVQVRRTRTRVLFRQHSGIAL